MYLPEELTAAKRQRRRRMQRRAINPEKNFDFNDICPYIYRFSRNFFHIAGW
jgi:hypothetical protein